MATRFYLPTTGTAPLPSLALDAGWTVAAADRKPMVTTKVGSSAADITVTTGGTTTRNLFFRQYQFSLEISGTLSGTVEAHIRGRESANTMDEFAQLIVYLVDSTGGNVRVARALDTFTTNPASGEFPASTTTGVGTNKRFPNSAQSNTLTSQDFVSGDVLVVEVGTRCVTPGGSTQVGGLVFGDNNGASDLGANETDTSAALDPWVEFSANLLPDPNATVTVPGPADATADAPVPAVFVPVGPPFVDASTPAAVWGTTDPATTSSFTPPDNSTLYALCLADSNNTFSVSSSPTLTWTPLGSSSGANGSVAVFRALVTTSPGATTVSSDKTGSFTANALVVVVLTQEEHGTYSGAKSANNTFTGTDTLVTTAADTWVWAVLEDNNQVPPGVTAGAEFYDVESFGGIGGAVIREQALTSTSGSSVTIGESSPSAPAIFAFEVKPAAAVDATVTVPDPADATADGLAPTVTADVLVAITVQADATADSLVPTVTGEAGGEGLVTVLAPVDATADVLVPVVSGDALVAAVLADATADGLTPVATGDARVVLSSSVAATADAIVPTVIADAAVSPSVVDATADAPAPTVAGDALISPSIASATADGSAPGVSGGAGGDGIVIIPDPADATADGLAPTVTADVLVAITVQADATADALAPEVGSAQIVSPPTADATGAALIPIVIGEAFVGPPMALATATAIPPAALAPVPHWTEAESGSGTELVEAVGGGSGIIEGRGGV